MKNWLERHPHSQAVLRWLQRWGGLLLLVVVGFVLARQAGDIDWPGVMEAVREKSRVSLVEAVAVTLLSYFTYACYDLIGRRQIGHKVLPRHCLRIASISYAINLTLGAMLGGAAIRLRLYSAAGLKPEQTAGVILSAIYTNWIGLAALAAVLFALLEIRMPDSLPGGALAAQVMQIVGTVAVIAYVSLCAWKGGQALAGHAVRDSTSPWQRLPGWRLAIAQVGLGALNWLWVAVVWKLLLGGDVGFGSVLGMVVVASLAGVVIRVPGGLGVLEAVAVGMLSGPQMPSHEVLAAALMFRAIYCILPLVIATVPLVLTEWRSHRARKASGSSSQSGEADVAAAPAHHRRAA